MTREKQGEYKCDICGVLFQQTHGNEKYCCKEHKYIYNEISCMINKWGIDKEYIKQYLNNRIDFNLPNKKELWHD